MVEKVIPVLRFACMRALFQALAKSAASHTIYLVIAEMQRLPIVMRGAARGSSYISAEWLACQSLIAQHI